MKSYSYSWPKYHWWQIRKKRQMSKAMENITPGTRIRFHTPGTLNDDFTITTIISVNGNTAIGEEKE